MPTKSIKLFHRIFFLGGASGRQSCDSRSAEAAPQASGSCPSGLKNPVIWSFALVTSSSCAHLPMGVVLEGEVDA